MLGLALPFWKSPRRYLGAWFVAALVLLSSRSVLLGQQPPNIILFLTDDQGWNGTSVLMDPDIPGSRSDYYLTPNLEVLAQRGMRFSRAYSSASLCQPTRAAIQTGMSPAQLQYTSNATNPGTTGYPLTPPKTVLLDLSSVTIPRWLEQHQPEYVTANFGKWHLTNAPSAQMGFDFTGNPGATGEDLKAAFGITEVAVGFMQERVQNDEPFYLQIGHNAVHRPVWARPETVEMFENIEPGTVHRNPTFAAMTYDLDASLGLVMNAIEDLGIEENTYIIFASDNGSFRSDSSTHPLGGGKNFLQEGGIRVPMVIAGPGIEAGSVSRVPVITTDFLSTIGALAGIDAPLPANVEGTSFAPVLFNGGDLPEGMDNLVRAFGPNGELFVHSPQNFGSPQFRLPPVSTVIRGDWKLFITWGENGGPDQIYLTDLSRNITEPLTLNADSAGNLAQQFPDIAADLEATLRQWLEGVDAPLAYDVKENIELHWDASRPGAVPWGWRSTTDVDYMLRETWERGQGQAAPQLVDTQPFQPELAKRAFQFDGDDRMTRKYFHVSDLRERIESRQDTGTADFDRSATFEFWLRMDDMTANQVLFESGERNQGLSITLGDGDSDGVHDEVRMRALGDDGQFLTVTAEIDEFSNPRSDFVHLVAVLNDSPDDRFAELYVNGAPLARANGQSGPAGSIRWDAIGDFFSKWGTFYKDGVHSAGLGWQDGSGLGAATGDGALPFDGGGFRGQIAQMRFFNHAISADEIRTHYNSVLDPPGLGVARVSGAAKTPRERPTDVSEGALEADDAIVVMQERTDVLDESLTLDFAAPILEGLTLPAGTDFTSFLIHYDPLGDPATRMAAEGEVSFAARILGVLYEPESLSETDATLGSIGRYDVGSNEEIGFFSLGPDGHSLSLIMSAIGDQVSQLRVLTERAILIDGDYNGDLRVDQADLDLVLIHWGADGTIPPEGWRTNPPGDIIGQAQLDDVLINWGKQANSLRGQSAAVPEPATLALLASMAAATMLLSRLRRR